LILRKTPERGKKWVGPTRKRNFSGEVTRGSIAEAGLEKKKEVDKRTQKGGERRLTRVKRTNTKPSNVNIKNARYIGDQLRCIFLLSAKGADGFVSSHGQT